MWPMQRRRAIESGLVVLALLAALMPIPAPLIERWFSAGLYPHLQRVVTPVTNLTPFAWFDVILIAVVGGAIALLIFSGRQARRERSWRPVISRIWTLIVASACCYLLFLTMWGMNYRRVSMTERLEMTTSTPARDDVTQLGLTAVGQMNALHAQAHTRGWPAEEWRDPGLVTAFHAAQQLLEDTPPVVPGRLKWTLLGLYFRWTGVDGMVNPFALEVLANGDLLPWERPFVAAHEWAHLAGFADESEASFVAWLATLRGNEATQYSGWLYVYWQVSGDVGRADREMLARALDPGPRRDVAAIVERLRRGQLPLLRNASWAVYDQYLRANRVEEGIRSYGEVVTLILRTRFEDGYRPVRREAAELSR
jgi:hypothetical protein